MILFCDNQSVAEMINQTSSKCSRCMYLLRLITLRDLIDNRRISARYVTTRDNYLADSLSRLKIELFK